MGAAGRTKKWRKTPANTVYHAGRAAGKEFVRQENSAIIRIILHYAAPPNSQTTRELKSVTLLDIITCYPIE